MTARVMEVTFFFLLRKCMRGVDKTRYEALAGGESLAAALVEFTEIAVRVPQVGKHYCEQTDKKALADGNNVVSSQFYATLKKYKEM